MSTLTEAEMDERALKAPATIGHVTEATEAVRLDIAQRLAQLTPRTSAAATDIVAILAAIAGTPTSISIVSPMPPQGGYNSTGTWTINVQYDSQGTK